LALTVPYRNIFIFFYFLPIYFFRLSILELLLGHAAAIITMASTTEQKDQDLGAPQFAYHAVVEPIVRTSLVEAIFND
jgi:hypothetical protein